MADHLKAAFVVLVLSGMTAVVALLSHATAITTAALSVGVGICGLALVFLWEHRIWPFRPWRRQPVTAAPSPRLTGPASPTPIQDQLNEAFTGLAKDQLSEQLKPISDLFRDVTLDDFARRPRPTTDEETDEAPGDDSEPLN